MTNCVFCNFSKIKDRTIATLYNINIVITLGQITNGGYLLLVPRKHSPCLGSLNKQETEKLETILYLTKTILEDEYQSPITIFEHGIVGQTVTHSHLHLLPTKMELYKRIALDFPSSKFESIENLTQLQSLYQKRQEPYLLWSTSNNKYLVCWNPPAEPEYLRTLSATALGVPERASWRKMDPVLDKKLADETMTRLFPLFNV